MSGQTSGCAFEREHTASDSRLVFSANLACQLALLELLNYAMQIGIAGAKAPREPGATTIGNFLAIGDHLKLAFPAMRNHGVNAEALLDEGRETRDLGLVVLSSRAGNYLDLHSVLQSAWCLGSRPLSGR